jgi:hypothetical protein
LEAAVDIQHFEIIVNAMLSWSDESKAPKKAAAQGALAARAERDDDDEFVDDDDFEPDEELGIKADAGEPAGAAPAKTSWPVSEQAD